MTPDETLEKLEIEGTGYEEGHPDYDNVHVS